MRKALVFSTVAVVMLGSALAGTAQADPVAPTTIPQQAAEGVIPYLGSPALQKPISTTPVPQNPFMAADPWSAIHDDTFASDTYASAGPLGRSPEVSSTWLGDTTVPQALVVGLTFDRHGHMVAGAIKTDTVAGTAFVQLSLIDPETLTTLATFDLPGETFTGTFFRPAGTYFYSDQKDRTVIGTATREVWVISHSATSFTREKSYSLRSAIPEGDAIEALQPDFAGLLWFTSKAGVIGTLDLASGKVLGTYAMGSKEEILNGHAAGADGGVYVASSRAMYRFDANTKGKPVVTWRAKYDAGTEVKPGQVGLGTGTTPTVFGKRYVAITDNAEPRMHVLVYDRAATARDTRLVCSVPVFQSGRSDTENSLIATDTSLVVENNYGYVDPYTTKDGATTTPGVTRIDIDRDGRCRKVWTNNEVSVPSAISKLSLATGLIYAYTKPAGPGTADPWYVTALDFATGEVVWSRLAGTGLLYNNHYAGIYLGPDGAAYMGVLGGIVRVSDTR